MELMADEFTITVALGHLDADQVAATYELVETFFELENPFDPADAFTSEFLNTDIKMTAAVDYSRRAGSTLPPALWSRNRSLFCGLSRRADGSGYRHRGGVRLFPPPRQRPPPRSPGGRAPAPVTGTRSITGLPRP